MNLTEVIKTHRQNVIEDSLSELSRSSLKHYSGNPEDVNRERLTALFDKSLECLELRNLVPMTLYAESIARKRFGEGYLLQEVQTAFNVLEEVLWQLIIEKVQPPDYPEALGLISSVMGAGKQSLAVEYVALVTGSPAKKDKDITQLFHGT